MKNRIDKLLNECKFISFLSNDNQLDLITKYRIGINQTKYFIPQIRFSLNLNLTQPTIFNILNELENSKCIQKLPNNFNEKKERFIYADNFLIDTKKLINRYETNLKSILDCLKKSIKKRGVKSAIENLKFKNVFYECTKFLFCNQSNLYFRNIGFVQENGYVNGIEKIKNDYEQKTNSKLAEFTFSEKTNGKRIRFDCNLYQQKIRLGNLDFWDLNNFLESELNRTYHGMYSFYKAMFDKWNLENPLNQFIFSAKAKITKSGILSKVGIRAYNDLCILTFNDIEKNKITKEKISRKKELEKLGYGVLSELDSFDVNSSIPNILFWILNDGKWVNKDFHSLISDCSGLDRNVIKMSTMRSLFDRNGKLDSLKNHFIRYVEKKYKVGIEKNDLGGYWVNSCNSKKNEKEILTELNNMSKSLNNTYYYYQNIIGSELFFWESIIYFKAMKYFNEVMKIKTTCVYDCFYFESGKKPNDKVIENVIEKFAKETYLENETYFLELKKQNENYRNSKGIKTNFISAKDLGLEKQSAEKIDTVEFAENSKPKIRIKYANSINRQSEKIDTVKNDEYPKPQKRIKYLNSINRQSADIIQSVASGIDNQVNNSVIQSVAIPTTEKPKRIVRYEKQKNECLMTEKEFEKGFKEFQRVIELEKKIKAA